MLVVCKAQFIDGGISMTLTGFTVTRRVVPPFDKCLLWALYKTDRRDECKEVPSGIAGYNTHSRSNTTFSIRQTSLYIHKAPFGPPACQL